MGAELPTYLKRAKKVMASGDISMPMAVGYFRPAILLPSAMLENLTTEQLRHVLLHETAHLLRRDDWASLAERLLRAMFAIQPAVYFIGRQIEREREIACDDWVVEQSGEAKPYARSLARLAELGSSSRAPILATEVGGKKQIFARLEPLLDRTRNRIPAVSEPLVLVACVILLVAVSTAPGSTICLDSRAFPITGRTTTATIGANSKCEARFVSRPMIRTWKACRPMPC